MNFDFSSEQKERIFERIVQISDLILKKGSGKLQNECFWPISSVDPQGEISNIDSVSIYNGVSGIILFLLRSFSLTTNAAYLDASIRGIKWAAKYSLENDISNSFYNGRLGVAYTLIKLSEVTGKAEFKEEAVLVVEKCLKDRINPKITSDLIDGIAGVILGFLKIFHEFEELQIRIDECIKQHLGLLLDRLRFSDDGVYCDNKNFQNELLGGLAHGSSGIAVILFLLARYYDNDVLRLMAGEALRYDDSNYSREQNNWAAYDRGIFEQLMYKKYQQNFLNGKTRFLSVSYANFSWCNGAVGNLIIRKSITNSSNPVGSLVKELNTTEALVEKYLEDLPPANNSNLCLCHGWCGAALYLVYSRKFNATIGSLLVERLIGSMTTGVTEKLITNENSSESSLDLKEDQDNLSLFLGTSGIGYFLISLLDYEVDFNPLVPWIELSKVNCHFESNWILRELAYKLFPKSLRLLEPGIALKTLTNSIGSNFKKSLIRQLEPELKEAYQREALHFDQTVNDLMSTGYTKPFLLVKYYEDIKLNENLMKDGIEASLQLVRLKINSTVRLVSYSSDFINSPPVKGQQTFIILFKTHNGLEINTVSKLCYLLLVNYQNNETCVKFIEDLGQRIFNDTDSKELEVKIQGILKHFTRSTVLLRAE